MKKNMLFGKNYLNFGPAQLFVLSFILISILGSLLLLLPGVTEDGISYVDALFTATSAVCVTGLNVVDTEFTFTIFGQIIILSLIQIGGLGIMTFTTYFSYFFKGGSSYKNQLLVKDITNEENLDNVFLALKSILIITFLIEGIGFLLIYASLSEAGLDVGKRIFFSIFHSVSSFCNAGFSTLSGNLFDIRIRFNFPVHIIMSFLIILGGLGFPIIYNIWKYILINSTNLYKRVFRHEKYAFTKLEISVNTHLVIRTTILLLLLGTFSFYFFEKDGVLTEYSTRTGKWIAAFFGSVTSRTAGFNSTNTAALSIPTSLMLITLMWVGASPASTGGGVKTTTFAIAFMNFYSLIRGKKRVEFKGREISQNSVSKAFAQITLAIIFIIVITFIMILIEENKEPMDLLFETVSAYSTVGLSRSVTPFLSDSGKLIITLTMLVGRVSLFTLLTALTKRVNLSLYRYPSEELLIN